MDGKRSALHGVDELVPATSAGGSCAGRQMDLLFGNIPSSLHIFPRGWHWNQWHKALPSGGNLQLAPPLFPLKYPHHEELGTTRQLQI